MYLPSVGKFISPDTIIPGASNPQAFNRYSYTFNNPIRYTDPTGHCPFCVTAVIGAAIGAIVGAVGYTAYTATTGQDFDLGEYFTVIGVSALAGAYIGSGIGIIHAAAVITPAVITTASVPITIGTAIASSAAGYGIGTAYSGQQFSIEEFRDASATGAISGGIDAAFPANRPIRLVGQTVLGVGQYIQKNGFNSGVIEAAFTSFMLAGVSEGFSAYGGKGSVIDNFLPQKGSSIRSAIEWEVAREQVGGVINNVGRSAYISAVSAVAENASHSSQSSTVSTNSIGSPATKTKTSVLKPGYMRYE